MIAEVSAIATTSPSCQTPVPISAMSRSAKRMPDGVAEEELGGAAQAMGQRHGDRGDGGDRGEEGLLVADRQGGGVGQGRCERGLQDDPPGAAYLVQPLG